MTNYALINFEASGGARAGLLVSGHVIDIGSVPAGRDFARMDDVLARWDDALVVLDGLAADADLPRRPLEELTVLAPVQAPLAVYCTGANYRDHVDRMNEVLGLPPAPDPHDDGRNPFYFLKSAHSVVAHDADVALQGPKMDWEAELAVVIGRKGKNISQADAPDYIAGYTIANDLSARDHLTAANVPAGAPFRYTWVQHKSFDGSCPLGPVLVPAKFIADPHDLGIKLWVNDVLKINSRSSQMIFNIAEQIAYLSQNTTIYPGDIILTGTPGGVGAETGEFLNRQDHVHIEIEGLGRLTTHIV